MKKRIIGLLLPVFLAMICGAILGRFVYKTYLSKVHDNLTSSKLYLIQSGEYDSINKMREDNYDNNYVYYTDDNKYKMVVGITKKLDNVGKIKKLYKDNVSVVEYYIQRDELNTKQDQYEKQLSETDDVDEMQEAVNNILNLYRNDDAIRLIQLN